MKFSCDRKDLNECLTLVGKAIPSRPSVPILANYLLESEEGLLRVTAFDLSISIRAEIGADVTEPGKLTLPAKLLGDIVSRLPDGNVAIESKDAEDSPIVTLSTLAGSYEIRGMDAAEYPELPIVEQGAIVLPGDALMQGIQGTLFATSSDESKQVLNGVHLTKTGDTSLEFGATDGHRLSVVQTETDGKIGEAIEVTIPSKSLSALEKMIGKGSEDVAVSFDQSMASFKVGGSQQLTTRLIEGQYPNYQQLIPKQFARLLTIDRRLFLAVLERISVLADQRNNVVKLSATADRVLLSVDAQDVGSGRESIAASMTGDAIDIAFNVDYLIEGVKNLPSADVQIKMGTPTSPVVLEPIGQDKITYLVMPVQVRS